MGAEIWWFLLPAVLLGTVLQRISGTGVGLVVAPVFAVGLGGAAGVQMTNVTTLISAALLTVAMRRRIQWGTWGRLAGASLLGVIPGALLVLLLPGAVLQLGVGLVVLAAMLITLGRTTPPERHGLGVTVSAGAAAGFLNASAGVAAPAMVMYSRITRWDQRAFAATNQPVLMILAVFSLLAKALLGVPEAAGLPPLPGVLGVFLSVLAGLGLGALLAPRVPAAQARTVALVAAGAGAALAVVQGAADLAGLW